MIDLPDICCIFVVDNQKETTMSLIKNDFEKLPIPTERLNIWLTLSAKSGDNLNIPPELLLSRLSYSHFIELVRVEDELQRIFYDILCPDKDDTLVKYSTAGMDDQLFVSKYLIKLPKKKVFEDFLKRELKQ